MKDHKKRQLIEELVATARKYAHTEQLRDRIAYALSGVFSELDEATARAERAEAELVELHAKYAALEAQFAGPEGFATWQDAAIAERVRRVAAEAELKAAREQEPIAHAVSTERCTVWWNDKFTHLDQCPKKDTPLYLAPIPAPAAQEEKSQ